MKSKALKVLFAVLIVLLPALAYYRFVFVPCGREKDRLLNEISLSEEELSEEQSKNASLEELRSRVESGKKKGSVVYDYDNAFNELNFLSETLGSVPDYNLGFGEPFTEDGIFARRSVDVSFVAENYAQAKEILKRMANCPYRLIVKDVSIVPDRSGGKSAITLENDCRVSVSTQVVFVELCENSDNKYGLKDLSQSASGRQGG
ncbi:MAG: hypothetical protein IJU01_02940 [Lachnospiraceae bacterium]|nr:hypothetical protein [Lachnospiraceae bacterium]